MAQWVRSEQKFEAVNHSNQEGRVSADFGTCEYLLPIR